MQETVNWVSIPGRRVEWAANQGPRDTAGSLFRARIARGSEHRIGGVIPREFAHEGYHRGMPAIMETEEVHFLDGLLDRPIVFGDAIGGHHDAAAVFTVFTMDKNLLAGKAAQKSKELSDLLVGRRRPATDRNVDVAQTERFGLLALGRDFVTPAAKIDDGGNTQLLEFGETLVGGLCPAKEKVVYFTCVRNSGECDLLGESAGFSGSVREGGGGLCKSCRRCDHGKEKNHHAEDKRTEMERVTHGSLDAVFYCCEQKSVAEVQRTNWVGQKHHHYK
jgi:hypothetical protein